MGKWVPFHRSYIIIIDMQINNNLLNKIKIMSVYMFIVLPSLKRNVKEKRGKVK